MPLFVIVVLFPFFYSVLCCVLRRIFLLLVGYDTFVLAICMAGTDQVLTTHQ